MSTAELCAIAKRWQELREYTLPSAFAFKAEALPALLAVLRRDWAVRVLDAYGRFLGVEAPYPYPKNPGFRLSFPRRGHAPDTVFEWEILWGSDESAARHEAATRAWVLLPTEVQAEIGACP